MARGQKDNWINIDNAIHIHRLSQADFVELSIDLTQSHLEHLHLIDFDQLSKSDQLTRLILLLAIDHHAIN